MAKCVGNCYFCACIQILLKIRIYERKHKGQLLF